MGGGGGAGMSMYDFFLHYALSPSYMHASLCY